MVKIIDIKNEYGDVTDFDFVVDGKLYHAKIDSAEFGSDGCAPELPPYDNAADYECNLWEYIKQANPGISEDFISDSDWQDLVWHFMDLIEINVNKYIDSWEDWGF